jgi:hypothetical protein
LTYDKIADIVVQQSFLGRKYGFGTVLPITLGSVATTTSTSMPKYQCIIRGAKDPYRLKNIISAQCQAHVDAVYLKKIAESTDKLREIAEKSVTAPMPLVKISPVVAPIEAKEWGKKTEILMPIVKAIPASDMFTGETLCFLCKKFLFDRNIDSVVLICSYCSKHFHKKCIESWVDRNGTCPSCKNPMIL